VVCDSANFRFDHLLKIILPCADETNRSTPPQANFKKWNDALKEKDYDKVAALYSSTDLSFLPTVSPKFIQDKESTKQYFMDFLKKLPEGTITQDNVQSYGADAYLHSGMYTFMTGPEEDRRPVEARFSYMWRKIDGEWKIVHHHSSALPGQPGTPPGPQAEEMTAEDMYPIAQANFEAWNDALKEKDYDKVAALYSSTDLSFLPTVSPKFIQDKESTKRYFMDFLKKLPEGTITQDNVQSYGTEAYLHSGLYTFMTGPEDDRQPVQARFSYMWRKFDGVWKIVHHHSSALPRQPGAPPAEESKAMDMYPIAQANFKKWNDALKEKNFKKVAGLYSAKDLSFLPTVSPKFIRDGASTEQYFEDFLKRLPDGKITQDNVQSFGPEAYLHSGLYTFQTGPEGDRKPVEARFSYMWRKIDGEWKIIHHHSSALPGQPAGVSQPPEELQAMDMYPVAQANFKAWNDALKEKDYDKVAALYSSQELSFLPTVSPKFIQDKESTKRYFMDFLKKLPEGTITQDNVQSYGTDAYLHSGMYTFMTGPEDDRKPVEARFSYMWRRIGGEWKIVHHHSSALPTAAAAPGARAEDSEGKAEDMYPVAQANFKAWNDALKEKDYDKVAGLYSSKDSEPSLLPVVSSRAAAREGRRGSESEAAAKRDSRRDFVGALRRLSDVTITQDSVQSLGPDGYLHNGLYTVTTAAPARRDGRPAGLPRTVEARFSCMWRRCGRGVWKIVHHHSAPVQPLLAPPLEEEEEGELDWGDDGLGGGSEGDDSEWGSPAITPAAAQAAADSWGEPAAAYAYREGREGPSRRAAGRTGPGPWKPAESRPAPPAGRAGSSRMMVAGAEGAGSGGAGSGGAGPGLGGKGAAMVAASAPGGAMCLSDYLAALPSLRVLALAAPVLFSVFFTLFFFLLSL
jgi:uncharacterized protein (TIGR02246 family)